MLDRRGTPKHVLRVCWEYLIYNIFNSCLQESFDTWSQNGQYCKPASLKHGAGRWLVPVMVVVAEVGGHQEVKGGS